MSFGRDNLVLNRMDLVGDGSKTIAHCLPSHLSCYSLGLALHNLDGVRLEERVELGCKLSGHLDAMVGIRYLSGRLAVFLGASPPCALALALFPLPFFVALSPTLFEKSILRAPAFSFENSYGQYYLIFCVAVVSQPHFSLPIVQDFEVNEGKVGDIVTALVKRKGDKVPYLEDTLDEDNDGDTGAFVGGSKETA